MAREPEQWGGEVHVPRWLRKVLRRQGSTTVGQNADRAAMGALTEMYHEGRKERRKERR
jgi:hypothetical protein